jgi:Asp-tRNA(Asn)/Glu-tRNA(Gln) amidotransferase A subunit family amidase
MGDQTYDLKSVKLPRFAGFALKLFVALIESPATRWMLLGSLLKQGGITMLRELRIEEPPTFLPLHPPVESSATRQRSASPRVLDKLKNPQRLPGGFDFPSISDYAAAYRKKKTTPDEIAERVIEAIRASNAQTPPLRAIIACDADDIRAQARDSAARIRAGKPRSLLEGVPIAVKDELDALPYPTKVGTRFMGEAPAEEDATVVARLRAAGALIIGKANMHEIGIGVTGHNPHNGTARNPYDPTHYTGGSSSGPASATASGLCPAAVGADGGGSIRIPSAFCGLVGLKSTFGRTSSYGSAPLTWSNDQLGPLAAYAGDAAYMYAIMAGPDPKDPNTINHPGMIFEGVDRLDLRGLTLGVYRPWFEHASMEVVEACKRLLDSLRARGAKVKDVVIPELDAARVAHIVSITSEIATAQDKYARQHRRDYSLEVRTDMVLARSFSARDYIQALRVRTRAMAHFAAALGDVDAIVTPATGCAAPAIPADALADGDSDLTTLLEIMRFATPANLIGLPAIAFPAGYTAEGLPIGFQAMGRPWEEHVLLRIARVAESLVERKPPKVAFHLLPEVD